MDALPGLIIALVLFALSIAVISRTAKSLMFLGIAAVVLMMVAAVGLLR